MLRNYLKIYPLSLFTLLVVILLSVCPIGAPEIARNVPLADKWTHMVMYFGISAVVCYEHWRSHRPLPSAASLLLCGLLFPAFVGGAMELIQAYCTTYRSGEWLDFVADSIGAAIGLLLALLLRSIARPRLRSHTPNH